jgi:hypothetical protein
VGRWIGDGRSRLTLGAYRFGVETGSAPLDHFLAAVIRSGEMVIVTVRSLRCGTD